MELPEIKDHNLLPEGLLHTYGNKLKSRLGDKGWNQRIKIERSLNPASKPNLLKCLVASIHRLSKSLVGTVLFLAGKKEQAQENCWKTVVSKHKTQLPNSRIPQPIRILHLSDFHLDTNLSQAGRWAEMIQELDYDFAVITGDFFNGFVLPTKEKLDAFQPIISAIKTPVFGILGNHDCLLTSLYLEKLGIKILLNETTDISVKNATIRITGLDDPHFFKSDDIDHAIRDIPTDKEPNPELKLLLVHAPKHPQNYAAHGFDLCLCGHTHGGQLCTSKGLPLLKNGAYAQDTISGWWQYGSMKGFTSRGTGTGRLTYRLNCAPEIVLHEIQPA